MDILLLTLVTLVVMYATVRSPVLGVGGSASVALIAIISGATALYWLPPVIGGFLMGLLTGARLRPLLVVAGAGAPAGLLAAVLVVSEHEEELRQELAAILGAANGGAAWPEGVPSPHQLVDVAMMLMPAFNIIITVAVMGICYGIALRVFPRAGAPVRRTAPLALWRLPFMVVWVLAAALAATAIGWSLDAAWLKVIGANACVLMGGAFFIQGVAVLRFALVARGVPGRWQLLIAAVLVPIMMVLPLHVLVAGLGLCDMWLDFRKLERGLVAPAPGRDSGLS